MAEKLGDHWLDIDRSVAKMRRRKSIDDINLDVVKEIQKRIDASVIIDDAEFTEVTEAVRLTEIDIYA